MKYLIFGNGFIGNKFNAFLGNSHLSKAFINSAEDAKSEIRQHNPEFVINCIGETGRPNVDWCESHKNETMFSNIVVPMLILKACNELGKKMVHMSTGCVYEGDNKGKGFSEDDEPNFAGSYYSRTKLAAERILKEFNVLQLRIRMPITDEPGERNLITKLLKYDRIISIPNSVTFLDDFLNAAKQLMEMNATGIFNLVNPQPLTHKEILDLYNRMSKNKKNYKIISINDLEKEVVARRSNCVLSSAKLEKLGIKMRDTQKALNDTVVKYIEKESEK